MRKFALVVSFFIAGACADSEKSTPVDMVYSATVTTTENTCDDYEAPDDKRVVVDVFLMTDGTVSFRNATEQIPGKRRYEGIPVIDGEVAHTFIETWEGDVDFHHDFDGVITDEKIDITLTVESRKSGDGPFVRCSETAHIVGKRRPLFDPTALEGKYRVRFDYFDRTCPGEPPAEPESWNAPMDVSVYTEGKQLLIFNERDQQFLMEIDKPVDGHVDWSGEVLLYLGGLLRKLEGSVTGTLEPGNVDMELAYRSPLDDPGCQARIRIRGGKFLPNTMTDDNEYRTRFDVADTCVTLGGAPERDTFEYPTEIVSQDDGTVNLLQGTERIWLQKDGLRIHNRFEASDGSATLTYEGTLTPPTMQYDVVYTYSIGTEIECTVTYNTKSHVRYYLPTDL